MNLWRKLTEQQTYKEGIFSRFNNVQQGIAVRVNKIKEAILPKLIMY